MLNVVGDEAVEDEADGRSLLDEIAREGARRIDSAHLLPLVRARVGFVDGVRRKGRRASRGPRRRDPPRPRTPSRRGIPLLRPAP
jgi:hypothetical protein